MEVSSPVTESTPEPAVDWQRRVVGRSLRSATERSVDRGARFISAAQTVLERTNGNDITVQEVADEAGQSLRTLYQYFESKDDLLLALFEEGMLAYSKLIERTVEQFGDPLERLAGAILAALRMPEISESGVNRGLARLRIRLSDTNAEAVGRAQSSVVAVIRALIGDAQDADRISIDDLDGATFLILSLNTAIITAQRVGNDTGVRSPAQLEAVRFCLAGMGADVSSVDLASIDRRVRSAFPPPKSATKAEKKAATQTAATSTGRRSTKP